jgi:hypothetical protein
VFRHPPTAADSPLWVCLKIINLGAVGPGGKGHRRGVLRSCWLYWGIDERRFRRSAHQRWLVEQQPAVYADLVAELGRVLVPGDIELELGPTQLAAERARLTVLRMRHREEDRRRAAAADGLGAAEPPAVDGLGADEPS